jgi:hypothetical protein
MLIKLLKNSIATIASVLFLVSFLFISFSASAEDKQNCGCENIKWQKAFDEAEHVVFGEVKVIQVHNDELATAEIKVMETFKGQADYIKKVVGSSKEGGSCRKVLRAGFYILYSFGKNNVVLNQCAASRQLNPKEDLVSTLSQVKKYAQSKTQPAQSNIIKTEQDDKKKSNNDEEVDFLQSIIDWFG